MLAQDMPILAEAVVALVELLMVVMAVQELSSSDTHVRKLEGKVKEWILKKL